MLIYNNLCFDVDTYIQMLDKYFLLLEGLFFGLYVVSDFS